MVDLKHCKETKLMSTISLSFSHKYKMANNDMVSKIDRSNYLRAYCEPATSNLPDSTQYCQSNAQ